MSALADLTVDQIASLIYWDTEMWFEVYGKIVNKARELVTPISNYLQKSIWEAWEWQDKMKLPVRLIILKPRQKGSSTFTTAIAYTRARRKSTNIAIMAHQYKASLNLLRMVENYGLNDAFPWGNRMEPQHELIEFTNGSKFELASVKNENAGRSDTLQGLIASEVGRYAKHGAHDGEIVLGGIKNSVPKMAGTFIIEESTPNGAAGVFYDDYHGAMTLRQAKDAHARGEELEM